MPSVVTQAFINAGTVLSNGTAYVMTENVTVTVPFTFSGSGAGYTRSTAAVATSLKNITKT